MDPKLKLCLGDPQPGESQGEGQKGRSFLGAPASPGDTR